MVNSSHKFAFIKSVMLQGITKFQYMCNRDGLDPEDKRYMPLHRERQHRGHERMLLKYVNQMLWFTDEKLSDPFRQLSEERGT